MIQTPPAAKPCRHLVDRACAFGHISGLMEMAPFLMVAENVLGSIGILSELAPHFCPQRISVTKADVLLLCSS